MRVIDPVGKEASTDEALDELELRRSALLDEPEELVEMKLDDRGLTVRCEELVERTFVVYVTVSDCD